MAVVVRGRMLVVMVERSVGSRSGLDILR
jgi:hypothetical protein